MRRPSISKPVNILSAAFVALLTLALASFALGAWQSPVRVLEGEMDARGNSFSGLYNSTTDDFEGTIQIAFERGATYSGGLDGHRFNGYGVLSGEDTLREGEVAIWHFEGTFVNGRLEGEGSYSDHLGSYTGTFSGSLPNGQGIYTSQSGWCYEGQFQAGRLTGQGTVTLADGSTSTGLFEDGIQLSVE